MSKTFEEWCDHHGIVDCNISKEWYDTARKAMLDEVIVRCAKRIEGSDLSKHTDSLLESIIEELKGMKGDSNE